MGCSLTATGYRNLAVQLERISDGLQKHSLDSVAALDMNNIDMDMALNLTGLLQHDARHERSEIA